MRSFRLRPVEEPEPAASGDGLMARVAAGDRDAFAGLYDELAPLVYGVVRKVVVDPAMSEEVSQEIFVELWRTAGRFDQTRGNVRSWAATIAHRRAVDRVRSEESRRRREERDHEGTVVDTQTDVVAEIVTTEIEHSQVRSALNVLSDTQRQAVELAYFGGKTYREVAELLGIPEGTAKTRIRDGLGRLRDTMGAVR